jgi:hypothetical protein
LPGNGAPVNAIYDSRKGRRNCGSPCLRAGQELGKRSAVAFPTSRKDGHGLDDDSRYAGGGGTLATVVSGAWRARVGVWALDRIDWFMWNRETDETRARTVAARPGGEPPAEALVTKLEDATGGR